MDVNYNTISTHLDIIKGINFLKNLKNKQNNFNDNFWNSDIYKKDNYNNYIRTFPYFWLDNDNYNINTVYKLNELKGIPWYYDFRVYEDVLDNMNIIDKKNLWKNFDYTKTYKNDKNLEEKFYIANDKILKTYMPRGYIIPPFDKNILNINYKTLTDDKTNKTDKTDKIDIDKKTENEKKYIEFEDIVKEYINNNIDNFILTTNIRKIKIIAEKNFNLLDSDYDNYITYQTDLKNLYLNLEKTSDENSSNEKIIENFANIINFSIDNEKIGDKIINDYIYLDDNGGINKKNYINSVLISYIYSKDPDSIILYNYRINSTLTGILKDKIKKLEELEDNRDNNTGNIDNEKKEIQEEVEKNEENDENNYEKIQHDTWKESLIKIGLWTIGIITIICILFFLSFVFIFNKNNDISEGNNEIINNNITSVSKIEE